MMMVFASGMSRPFSMIEVAQSTVVLMVHEGEHHAFEFGLWKLAMSNNDTRARH